MKPGIENDERAGKGLLSTIQSVLAAMFGVQSETKRETDFKEGKASDFIVVGIIIVALFVVAIIWLANYIVDSAGVS